MEIRIGPPDAVIEIARRLEEAGFEAWAVGGAVRDALLGLQPEDWDLATSARPPQVRKLFRRTVPIGIPHGTVGVLDSDGGLHEVTTFRRDVETFGRHAVVEFADTIEEDLARRDFTCNAMAWHPLRDELRDPFAGRADLGARRLRTVGDAGERFSEDYLRVLRALRFAGQLGLDIEAGTWGAIEGALPSLTRLSAERVREELWKVLAKASRASASLSLYAASGVLAALYPELDALVGLRSAADEPDSWTESVLAVDALPPTRVLLRVAALLHAVGMPDARTRDLRGGWNVTGHGAAGAPIARKLLRRLKASNADTAWVSELVGLQEELFPPDARPAVVRRWLRRVSPARVPDLFRLRMALWRARYPGAPPPGDLLERWRMARAVLRERPALEVADLAIGGAELRELGLEPGPRYGEILDMLLDRVIEEPGLNTRQALLALAEAELW